MTFCREHHFNSSGRCSYCQMQARYYYEGLATLKKWSKEEIIEEARRYQSLQEGIMCKLHSHDSNPLEQLYNMESD